MSNDWNQALLLFFVGIAVGLYVAYRLLSKQRDRRQRRLSADYYRGLNFLLNDQPDQALDIFVRLMSSDHESIETHFALGALFRRRGEIDRAIRIHQNLIARPTLEPEEKNQALYALVQDYIKAGLYDRAERLLYELVNVSNMSMLALGQLGTIYELQKDWEQAIEARQRLQAQGGENQDAVIAHYWCELAEIAMAAGQWDRAHDNLRRARVGRQPTARAYLLVAKLMEQRGQPAQALPPLMRAVDDQPSIVIQAFPQIVRLSTSVDNQDKHWQEWVSYITGNVRSHSFLGRAMLIHRQTTLLWALPILENYVRNQGPLIELIHALSIDHALDLSKPETLQQVSQALATINKPDTTFNCRDCQYTSDVFHWQCPTCKNWGSIDVVMETATPALLAVSSQAA